MKIMKYQVSLVGEGSIDEIEDIRDLLGREFAIDSIGEGGKCYFKIWGIGRERSEGYCSLSSFFISRLHDSVTKVIGRRVVYFECWGEGKYHVIRSGNLSVRVPIRATPQDVIDAVIEEVEYRLGGEYEDSIMELLKAAHEKEMELRRKHKNGAF
jgi:hypothetical protein